MLITELTYFGTIDFIKTIIQQDEICFDNQMPFSKMTFKNRMVIASAQGPLHLTIPVIGGRDQKIPFKEVKIAYDSPWNLQHMKAIISCYQRAPYFEYYKEDLIQIYNSHPEYLIDFLMTIHVWVRKQLKGKWNVLNTLTIANNQLQPTSDDQIIMTNWLPKNYQTISNPIYYQQVFEDRIGFLPNVSILDLLFCCGGKQAYYLLSK